MNSGCGTATSDVGPFYCPADGEIYIDLRFFQELEQRFGAQGGTFARAYVIAHEYGHHVQNLLGTSDRVRAGDTGPTSGSVRLELQADCYAGVWAKNASTTPGPSGEPLITGVTKRTSRPRWTPRRGSATTTSRSSSAAGARIASQFTHGSSEQRQKWYLTGYQSGDPASLRHLRPARDLG